MWTFLLGLFTVATLLSLCLAIGFVGRYLVDREWVLDTDTFLGGVFITILLPVAIWVVIWVVYVVGLAVQHVHRMHWI